MSKIFSVTLGGVKSFSVDADLSKSVESTKQFTSKFFQVIGTSEAKELYVKRWNSNDWDKLPISYDDQDIFKMYAEVPIGKSIYFKVITKSGSEYNHSYTARVDDQYHEDPSDAKRRSKAYESNRLAIKKALEDLKKNGGKFSNFSVTLDGVKSFAEEKNYYLVDEFDTNGHGFDGIWSGPYTKSEADKLKSSVKVTKLPSDKYNNGSELKILKDTSLISKIKDGDFEDPRTKIDTDYLKSKSSPVSKVLKDYKAGKQVISDEEKEMINRSEYQAHLNDDYSKTFSVTLDGVKSFAAGRTPKAPKSFNETKKIAERINQVALKTTDEDPEDIIEDLKYCFRYTVGRGAVLQAGRTPKAPKSFNETKKIAERINQAVIKTTDEDSEDIIDDLKGCFRYTIGGVKQV